MVHIHNIVDTDIHYKIDGVSRAITNIDEVKKTLVQHDHNSEVLTFEIPRYIDGHDLTKCNSVGIHYINIETSGKEKYEDVYDVEDLGVKKDDEQIAIFTWTVSELSTQYAGTLNFTIRFACVNEEGKTTYAWHTLAFRSIYISDGIFNSKVVVENHSDILDQWYARLFTENDEAVNNIITAKNAALTEIENKETSAVKAVGDKESIAISEVNATKEEAINKIITKGREVLDTIPDDYVALDAKVEQSIALSDKTRIINNSKGSMHALSDSAEAPFQGMRIFGKTKQTTTTGKNKLPYMGYRSKNNNPNGLTYTENEDESITISGTTTGYSQYYLCEENIFEDGKQYSLPKFNDGTITLYINYLDGDGNNQFAYHLTKNFVWSSKYTLKAIYLQVNNKTVNETIYPIIVEGSTYDGNWEPYTGGMPSPSFSYKQDMKNDGDKGNIELFVKGKNLLNNDISAVKRVTYTVISNQRVTRSGYELHLSAGTYTATLTELDTTVEKYWYGLINDANGHYVRDCKLLQNKTNYTPLTFTINEGDVLFMYDGQDKSPTDSYNVCLGLCQVQIEAGTVATPYEPYKSQSLTIPTPNGLPGVPVSSGGNYTDENGQQYVSDYKDYERMVYVQRIKKITLDGNEDWVIYSSGSNQYTTFAKTSCFTLRSCNDKLLGYNTSMCTSFKNVPQTAFSATSAESGMYSDHTTNTFMYFAWGEVGQTVADWKAFLAEKYTSGTPVEVLYILAELIETPLSEEEIAAYKALHTNKPYTTIYNSDGAHMEVEYVADPKLYIDNKFAELQANILNATE